MNEEDLIYADEDDEVYDIDDDPCLYCGNDGFCDGWDARYCCVRCHWLGLEDCDNCDSMDI